ncbi:hypothetical protein GS454_28175 [Rhodococcus hoagii]|nr:hypothetical protein [Prescottella equi]
MRSNPHESDFPFPAEYRGAYQQRRKECAMQLYASVGIAPETGRRRRSRHEELRPVRRTARRDRHTDAALGVYGAVDCGLYVNTFLLAAQSLGVASIPQAALAGSAPYLRSFLDLPEDRKVVCAISFGYADESHPANGFRTTRADIASVATWVS